MPNEIVVSAKGVPVETKESNLPAMASPALMMQYAVQNNIDVDKIDKLIDTQAKWHKLEAEKAYTEAMAEFKKKPLQILKNKHVDYITKNGIRVKYDHSTLGNAIETTIITLAEHGFSAEWEMEQGDNKVTVSCVLTHKDGHSKKTTLSAGYDTSGGKNTIQALGSTVKYLERYTFLARVGLATQDQDDDGIGSEPVEPVEYIDDKQKGRVVDMLSHTEADVAAFTKYIKVDSVDNILKKDYKKVMAILEKKQVLKSKENLA